MGQESKLRPANYEAAVLDTKPQMFGVWVIMKMWVASYWVHYYCEPIVPPPDDDIFVEHCFVKTGKGKQKYVEENQSHCNFAHTKKNMSYPRTKPESLRGQW